MSAYDPTLLLTMINQLISNIVSLIEQFGILGFEIALVFVGLYLAMAMLRGIRDVILKKN